MEVKAAMAQASQFRPQRFLRPHGLRTDRCCNTHVESDEQRAWVQSVRPCSAYYHFNSNQMSTKGYTILNDSYALGCGTLAIGAFMLIPFALKYGRRPIYIVSIALQFGISIWSAKIQTVADIMLVNAFSCLLGALAEVICNMTIADVYFVHQRGKMNSIYVWFMSMGGSMAPVAAGYITTSQGWRWVWSVCPNQ